MRIVRRLAALVGIGALTFGYSSGETGYRYLNSGLTRIPAFDSYLRCTAGTVNGTPVTTTPRVLNVNDVVTKYNGQLKVEGSWYFDPDSACFQIDFAWAGGGELDVKTGYDGTTPIVVLEVVTGMMHYKTVSCPQMN